MMKTKTFFKATIFLFASQMVWAQAPEVQWDKSSEDYTYLNLTSAHDGGILSLGTDGNNLFILNKFNLAGDWEWEKSLDLGEYESYSDALYQAADGNYTFIANQYFEDESTLIDDYFLVKIDSNGNQIANNQINVEGGVAELKPASDGGFVIIAEDNDENTTLMKITQEAEILWQNDLDMYIMDANETSDGGYIVAGESGDQFRVQKLDANRTPVWTTVLNNQFEMDWMEGLQEMPDGGYVCLVNLREFTGQDSFTHNWIVKFNESGEILWQNIYNNQYGMSLIVSDNGEITVASDDDTFMTYYADGTVKWYLDLENQSYMYQIIRTSDNGFAFTSEIPTSEQFGTFLVKLSPDQMGINDLNAAQVDIYPNPASDFIRFSEKLTNVSIYDLAGKLLISTKLSTQKLNVSNLPSGVYVIKGQDDKGNLIQSKFIKN